MADRKLNSYTNLGEICYLGFPEITDYKFPCSNWPAAQPWANVELYRLMLGYLSWAIVQHVTHGIRFAAKGQPPNLDQRLNGQSIKAGVPILGQHLE